MPRRATEKGDVLARVVMKTAHVGQTAAKGAEVKDGPTSAADVANIIEFVESSWGLGLTLFPVQRIILKAHYGIPLDDTKEFEITDWRRERKKKYTEKTYLEHLHATGRSNIKTVKEGEERRTMVLALGRRSGKCVVGSTWIFTDKGLVRIAAMDDGTNPLDEHYPMDVGVAQEGQKKSRSSHFYRGGLREVFRVKTSCGYEVAGTANHRIRIRSASGEVQWKRMDEIRIGDIACIHRGANLWGASSDWSRSEAVAYGIFLARQFSSPQPGWSRSELPESLLRAPREVVCEFLRACLSRGFDTEHPSVLEAVQLLLLNLGVVTRRRSVNDKILILDLVGKRSEEALLRAIWSNYGPPFCIDPAMDVGDVEEDEGDYFFDPIEDLEEGQDFVFDLCVPDGESFVANGFTNHNTSISACIVAYEVYKLIHKSNPQKYYGLVQGNRIQLVSLATSKDQASLLFAEAAGHFTKCSFFKKYRANNTMSYIKFQSPWEIETYGTYEDNPSGHASIKVSFAPSNANTIRGAGNIVAILDETAHFIEKGNKSAEKVYTALAPSVASFTPKGPNGEPRDGRDTPSDARVIMISSPLGKSGLFYQKFRQGFEGGQASENMLCIQAPTWEVNPTVSAAVFVEQYATDPRQFDVEFGANFSDRTLGFFEEAADIEACIDRSLRRKYVGIPNIRYFLGFDLGLVEDSSALALVHIEGDRIITDVVDELKAGVGKHRDKKRLEFDDVAAWIYEYSRFFSIQEGLFDQWSAIPLEQALAKKGLVQIKSDHMTAQKNSEIYLNLKSMIFDRRVILYDITEEERQKYIREGKTPPEHLPYIIQLLELQAQYKSKYVTEVGAPKTQGKHDDLADALARAVWLASMQMGNIAYVSRSRAPGVVETAHRQSYEDMAKGRAFRRLGGSDIKRMVPKNRGLFNWYAKRYSSG